MSVLPSQACHRDDPDVLIREFRDYLEKWTCRMRLAGLDDESQALAHRLFDELLTRLSASCHFPTLPRRIHGFIAANLHKGLTLKDLSEFLGYSEKYCSELFQAQMGETFSSYVRQARLERAKRLLRENKLTLTHVAESVGFRDQFSFSHFF